MKKIFLFLGLLINSFVLFSQGYHDTQGKLDITNSGQAVFTVPIAIPPSLQNVGPTINLVYASGQSGGVIGQGWNINSISMISRMASSIHVDGYVDGVDFDDNDKLALDGQRLLVKTGNYWVNGSTYQTEIQSNNKIELFRTGENIYFIVTNTDGSRSWYGNYGGVNATDLTAYYIIRFEDSHGNYVLYDYFKPFGKSLCLKNIKFSANINGILPVNEINFNYKQAKRIESSFIKGVKHEKDALLSSVEVKTNNQQFRRYEITHREDIQLGYEKVVKIQEFNGANESANPIEFFYNQTQTLIEGSEKTNSYNNNLPQGKGIPGDYDGDGKLDIISENKLFLNLFTGNSGQNPIDVSNLSVFQRIPITTLKNNRLVQKQSIADLQMPELNSLTFKIYNFEGAGSSGSLQYNFQKTIQYPNSASCYSNCPSNACESLLTVKSMAANEFLEGDFNGDGISELLLFGYAEQKTKIYTPSNRNGNENSRTVDPNEDCITTHTIAASPNVIRILDLNPNSDTTLGTKGYVNIDITGSAPIHGKHFVNDFNGDGKADLLAIRNDGSYSLFTFNQLNLAPWIQIEVIGQGIFDEYEKDKVILFGDFNGDSKSDIMIPVEEDSSNWTIYYSNPINSSTSCFVSETHNIVNYKPFLTYGDENRNIKFENFYALDTNKDGKSDLVKVTIKKYHAGGYFDPKDYNTAWSIKTFANNIGNTQITGNKFTLDYQTPCRIFGPYQICENFSDSPALPMITVGEFKNHNANNEIVVLNNHYNTITYIDLKKDVSSDNLMIKVVETGTNNTFDINYSSMESVQGANGSSNEYGNFYSFSNLSNSPLYPNIELHRLPQNLLVSKLTNTVQGISKSQDFKYHGYVVNLHGVGTIGFKSTARSSWNNSSATKKTWSVIENNPLLRGATTKSFTQVLNSGNSFVFFNTSNIINTTTNEFNIVSNTPYTLLQTKQTSLDLITNVKTESINEFSNDGFFIPFKTTKKNFLGTELQGTSISTTYYTNNASASGNNYFIGRPNSVVNKTSILLPNIDTTESTEKYFYTGNLLTETWKKGNSTVNEYLIEKYTYDFYGNVIKKEISATPGVIPSIAARDTEQIYDSTGRFIISSKDVEDLITTYSYHPIYGAILTTTNPFNQTTTNEYDNWGKIKKVTDFLNNSKNYTYTKENNTYKTTIITNDGSASYNISDLMGRPIKSGKKNIDGTWSYVSLEYDYLGRKIKQSEPYSGNTPTLWEETLYDDYGRVITTNYPSGLSVNLTYTGLTVTANDGTKQTSSTKNANGLVIQSTDPGGTVNFKYYANGNLKESIYEGTVVKMEYDSFGRKNKLIDPSAGTYIYKYNFYGELIEEKTPKGITTINYDNFGKIANKNISGLLPADATNITSVYSYNSVTKLLENIAVTNPIDGNSNYIYEYDPHKRLNKTIEVTPYAHFENELVFDSFGRVEKTKYQAKELLTNKTSLKWVKHTYVNGYHHEIRDNITNNLLWSINTVNSRGQVTGATFGNGLIQSNTYDNFGLPSIFNTSKIIPSARTYNPIIVSRVVEPGDPDDPIDIDPIDPENTETLIELNYGFNSQRGLLLNRQTNLFNLFEIFEYDNLERLTVWKSPDETLHNLTFTGYSNTEGFLATSGTTISNSAGRLRINTTPAASGAQKLILQNANLGTKLNITATVNKNTTNKIRVVIIEKNPVTNATTETVLGFANEGIFTSDYIVSSYKDVYLKFDKAPNSTDVGVLKTFYVDNVIVKKINIQEQAYDNKGRVSQNRLGNYSYDTTKQYQNNHIVLSPAGKGYYSQYSRQDITYNAFKSPIQIHEQNIDKISFAYNIFQNRSSMFYGNLESNISLRTNRKHYSADGTIEIKHNINTGNVEFITYIGGDGYTAPIIYKDNGITQEYLYLHRDYLGSIVAITNQGGTIVEKRHFDAWGKVEKVQDGAGNNLAGLTVLDRGYTGHEHLQSVGLIHMNGRLYDPMVHRFLQPDNYIQDPYNTQNYNRYGYVLNNPLKYTDPSGEELLTAVLVGAAISATFFTLNAWMNDKPITLMGFVKATFMGAISGAVTFGIGSGCESIGGFWLKASVQAIAHGGFQGGMSYINSGDFWTGFASGSIGSVASSLFMGANPTNETFAGGGRCFEGVGSALGMDPEMSGILFSTISGGATAELTGGNFIIGAGTGLMVSGLNHAMHDGDNGYDTNGNKISNKGGDKTDYLYDKEGNLLGSKDVNCIGTDWGKMTSLNGSGPKLTMRGFGVKSYLATGAITEDNTIFEFYAGGKLIGTGLSYLGKGLNLVKVPVFRAIGQGIRTYAPKLGANRYLRIGTSTSRGNEVFRITWGNNSKHLLDINLGKIPKIK